MTRDELIIEMQPFSRGLKEWCRTHPDFTGALKIIYPERFITLQAVATSYSPNCPDDEVIGVYILDYGLKTYKFKQDFIINKGKRDEEFILFTRYSKAMSGKYIKDINEFFATYGKGGYYTETHHVSLEQLPDRVKQRAPQAIALANRLKKSGLRHLNTKDLEKMSIQIQTLRNKGVIS